MSNYDILKEFTYGIYVLGASADNHVNAMIASWVTQCSAVPLRVAVAVNKARYTHDLIAKGQVFSLNLLRQDQADIISKFKGEKEVDGATINGAAYDMGATGAPILRDAVGAVEFRLTSQLDAGDHTLFIGEAVAEHRRGGGAVLSSKDLVGHIYEG
jgi:flavin reductase (DIM6/NTAB) family NADH-FMN oxidoreductase RutF